MTAAPLLWIGASYLLGAIPFSYLAGRLVRGIDLREHGSGNLGATNAFRVLGAKVAAPVMVLDVLKGFVPAFLFAQWDGQDAWAWALAYGAAAIVGHVLPVYMRFRGGKGVATTAGVFLALAPAAVGLALAAWLVVLALSRMVSLASLIAAVVLPPALWLTRVPVAVLVLGCAVALFVVYAHRANIGRLMRGEEPRFGRKAPPAAPPRAGVGR